MSATEQINAYLAWRSEREGKTVDVSPEAYERDFLTAEILRLIRNGPADPHFNFETAWGHLESLVNELDELEDN